MGRRGADARREIQAILRLVDKTPGWSWMKAGHGYKMRTPAGVPIFCSATPSDIRATKNLKAQLRRHGLNC